MEAIWLQEAFAPEGFCSVGGTFAGSLFPFSIFNLALLTMILRLTPTECLNSLYFDDESKINRLQPTISIAVTTVLLFCLKYHWIWQKKSETEIIIYRK